ncbi:hypothetical protein ATKI12_5771 [Kitasatospora sp. Ki12]
MSSTLLVKAVVRTGLAVGTVGKGAKPHAFKTADAADMTGVTLCNRKGRVEMTTDAEAELCNTCSAELIELLGRVFEGAPTEREAAVELPVTAEKAPEVERQAATVEEAPTVIVPGPEVIETTQDREEAARQDAAPTRALVTTTDFNMVEGMTEILNAGAGVIADAFRTTISIGKAVANTMLQLRRYILVDGLPSLDGKSNQYQAAVKKLFDLAAERVSDVHEVDVKEIRNQIKRAAQNQMSAVLIPYVQALDTADEEERTRYAPLLEKAQESQRQAIESAQAYLDAAIKKDDQEHIDLATETLELAQRPISLTDLVHDAFNIPRQTRQELSKADAARRRELAKANKAARDTAPADEPEQEQTPAPTPVAPATSTPTAMLDDVAKALTVVPLAPVSMMEGEERDALLGQLDAIEKLLAEIRDAANPL